MKLPHELNTLSETMKKLKDEGVNEEFEIKDGNFVNQHGEKFKPEDLTIVKVHRFEGISDPDDMSVLYVLKSKTGTHGIFIDAFGFYADQDTADALKKINIVKDH